MTVAYPNLPTRTVRAGGAGVLETVGAGLLIRATVQADRALTLVDGTTFRLLNAGSPMLPAPANAPLVFDVNRTDISGVFIDPATGEPIVITEGRPYTHRLTIVLEFLTPERKLLPQFTVTYAGVEVPDGDEPLNLDLLTPTTGALPQDPVLWILTPGEDWPPNAPIGALGSTLVPYVNDAGLTVIPIFIKES